MIDVEISVMLVVSIFFTLLYALPERRSKISIAGIIAFVSWWIVGFLWLFLAHEPVPQGSGLSYGTYSISLFFFGIGLILLIYQILDLLNIGKHHKELGEVEY